MTSSSARSRPQNASARPRPEQREREGAAEPRVARADDEAHGERDRAADGGGDAQADRPGGDVGRPGMRLGGHAVLLELVRLPAPRRSRHCLARPPGEPDGDEDEQQERDGPDGALGHGPQERQPVPARRRRIGREHLHVQARPRSAAARRTCCRRTPACCRGRGSWRRAPRPPDTDGCWARCCPPAWRPRCRWRCGSRRSTDGRGRRPAPPRPCGTPGRRAPRRRTRTPRRSRSPESTSPKGGMLMPPSATMGPTSEANPAGASGGPT